MLDGGVHETSRLLNRGSEDGGVHAISRLWLVGDRTVLLAWLNRGLLDGGVHAISRLLHRGRGKTVLRLWLNRRLLDGGVHATRRLLNRGRDRTILLAWLNRLARLRSRHRNLALLRLTLRGQPCATLPLLTNLGADDRRGHGTVLRRAVG